jgi:hypothetical protein
MTAVVRKEKAARPAYPVEAALVGINGDYFCCWLLVFAWLD